MSFWKELSRRNVVKVGIAYAVAAWLIIHPVDIIFPILHLPEWSITLVAAFLIILFPLVLIFSWVYEVTPKGLKKTKEVPVSKSITYLTGRRLNYIIIGLLVLAVALLIFDNFYRGRRTVEIKETPATREVVRTQETIAVLPFEDLSPAKDQGYFVDGLSEEILNSLTQIHDLTVIARTSSFSFKGKDKTIQEIAAVLGVENILEGSVRKAGNALRITAQLVKAVDGSHIWSKTYDRELKDIFAVQEDIATAVADELEVTLGIGKSFKQLGGTDNEEAYQLYLVAKGKRAEDNIPGYNSALELLDAAIVLDPKFALAWAFKAYNHNLLSIHGPSSQSVMHINAALNAAQKAIELEPNLGSGYVLLGEVNGLRGKFIEAGLAFRKALELSDKSFSYEDAGYGFYLSVGNFKKAYKRIEEIRQNDPINQNILAWYYIAYGLLGDRQRAEEEYQRRNKSFLKDSSKWHDNTITFVRLCSGDVISSDEIVSSDAIDITLKEYIDSPEEGLVELRRFYGSDDDLSASNLQIISMWAAYFDDPEFAMDAIEKGVSINASGLWVNWFPVMHEVRQLPRFKKFVKEIGLVDYWNKFGWPDMCHQLDNGDFECD